MEGLVKGDIIVVPFPFTDLSASRKRPALVLSNSEGEDIIICEVTSKIRNDRYVVSIENKDLSSGNLKTKSIIRPNRILTIHQQKIRYKLGSISKEKNREVEEKISELFL